MSFDLGVWSSSKKIADQQAGRIYEQLCAEGRATGLAPQSDAQERIAAFLQELEQKYPSISSDVWDDETIDDCPWSCDFDVSDVHVLMSCVWPRADEVSFVVEGLAYKHELVCYDPQSDAVRLPASLGGAPPRPATKQQTLSLVQKRLIKREINRKVIAAIERALGALGFRQQFRPGPRSFGHGLFVRQVNVETVGLVYWRDLSSSDDTASPYGTVSIGVRNQRLEKALAEQQKERFHPYWPASIEVDIDRLMGTNRPFYEFEGEGRNEEVAEQIAAAVREYGIPFQEAHGSLATLRSTAEKLSCWTWPEQERSAMARRLIVKDRAAIRAATSEPTREG
jgi:hypothetical protein